MYGDLDDPTSLNEAFAGAYGAFCVTNFWEHFSPDRELAQAANLAQAAQHAGIRHAIWSTLEDVRRFVPLDDARMPTLMGQYKVPHFDAKGEANRRFEEVGVPTTYLHTSFYWDNFISFGMGPRRDRDGRLAITLPLGDAPLPSIAAEDIGGCAYGIFSDGPRWIGRTVGIAGDHVTGHDMAAGLTAALGETVRYDAVSPDQYRSLGFPGAEDLSNMFQFNVEYATDYCAARDLVGSHRLNPTLQSYDTWVTRTPTESLSADVVLGEGGGVRVALGRSCRCCASAVGELADEAPASPPLRLIEPFVGPPGGRLELRGRGSHRESDRDGHVEVVGDDRPVLALDRATGPLTARGRGLRRGRRHQDQELLTAAANDDVVVAQRVAQQAGDTHEYLVARIMAEPVVDGLEVIKVESGEREWHAEPVGVRAAHHPGQVATVVAAP